MAPVMPDKSESEDLWDAVSTSHLLHRAQQLASDRFAFLVGENGVTLRQFVVMTAIGEAPGVSQIDLVRATGVDRSTLADVVTRLEKRGWIARKASPADARANAVELTEAGIATLAQARQHAKAADAAILDALPRSKRKTLRGLLVRLSKHADKLAHKAERAAKQLAKREAKQRARDRRKQVVAKANDAAAQAPAKTPPGKRKTRRKADAR